MRLLAFSDWRTQSLADALDFASKLDPPADFILYGGDDVARFEDGRGNFFSQFAKRTRQGKVLAVIGNDDCPEAEKVLQAEGVHNLHAAPFVCGNYIFLGLEAATTKPAVTLHTETEVARHLKEQCRRVGRRHTILLSHTPPYGVLDRGIRFASFHEDSHHNIGSTALREFVEAAKPGLVICGHCHSHGGQSERMGNTLVLNVASHDDRGAIGRFAIIDLSDTINVQWHTTSELDLSGLTSLHGIGSHTRARLAQANIRSVQHLADVRDLAPVSNQCSLSVRVLKRLQLTAMARLRDTVFKAGDFVFPTRDVIYFDIETDLERGKVWLVGALMGREFSRFYADTWGDEKKLLQSFLSYLESTSSSTTLVSYSGSSFDRNVLRRALARHELDESRLAALAHLDLCTAIRRAFILPTSGYSLKSVAPWAGYPTRHPDLNGFAVASSYERHLRTGAPVDPVLFEYNEDDVQALPFLARFFSKHAANSE
jgi:Icc-related predicted phosphoesterase/uncharacterized protein YprB with RNaseH-like and TPR domain